MTSAQFAQPTRGDEVQLGPFLADLPSIVCQRQVVLDKARNLAEKYGGIGGDLGGRWNQGLGPFCARGALAHDELSVGSA